MIIIEVFHTVLIIFVTFYGYFTQKNGFDFFYLIYYPCVQLSWTFFKGECPISYYYKKITNSTNESIDSYDLNNIFGEKYKPLLKKFHRLIFNIGMILFFVSYYLVMVRQKFPMISMVILFFIYTTYYINIINDMHYHFLFRVINTGCLLYILSLWK